MQDQPIESDGERRGDQLERFALTLLLDPGVPGPWSMQELTREVGCEIAAALAVMNLHAAGLVHRSREFVWATRPAARCSRLVGGP